jgi:hypothetical protein
MLELGNAGMLELGDAGLLELGEDAWHSLHVMKYQELFYITEKSAKILHHLGAATRVETDLICASAPNLSR